MTTKLYKTEFKDWYLESLKDKFYYSDREDTLTLFRSTEDIHNHIHKMMFVDDDDLLRDNLRELMWLTQSSEKVITFN